MRSPLVALCLLLAAVACRTPRAGGGQTGNATQTVEGEVEEVGRDDGTVTLRVGEERQEILVAPEAEIRIDDFRGTFEDIKEGQRVRASLEETGEQTEGFKIQILDQGVTPLDEPAPDGAAPHASPRAGAAASAEREAGPEPRPERR